MAKKNRFVPGFSASYGGPRYESEGSGSSGRIDSAEDSSVPMRKWIDLNSASGDGFVVPMQVISLSKLSSSDRKKLAHRLTLELQQIRLVQKRVESEKTKFLNEVTGYNNTQQNGPKVGYAKKSSGLGNGPGKKAHNWNRGIAGKFEPANQNMRVNPHAGLLKQCESLLSKLMSQQYAWVFNIPVDPVKLNIPDYFKVIKNPMDLETIKSKLSSGKYFNPLEFLDDVRLTFTNAKTYNPPGTDVHVMADVMSQFFELRWKVLAKKLTTNNSQSLPQKSGMHEKVEIAKPMLPSKKRKLSPMQQEVIQEPVKWMMTDEEKRKLSSELEDVLEDLPENIINFLKAQSLKEGDDGREDEIEIDIDDLSDETLFTLRKLLDNHLQNKQNISKSEACEIELPNVSGLNNSSLQEDKGNDQIDEDVDIGGNEAPVNSYPPVEIVKDEIGEEEAYTGTGVQFMVSTAFVSGLDQLEKSSHLKQYSSDSDGNQDGESTLAEKQVSPNKQYRAALLKGRFVDTILKAREKTLNQDDKGDPEKLQHEREKLEMHKKREKARLQAEAKAAEDARKRAEAEAAAEVKRRREIEREAAREALLKIERTVEINENSRILEDLEMLKAAAPSEQLPNCEDAISPDNSLDSLGNFSFVGGNNPLEKLGLYMKMDDEEEEGEPPGDAKIVIDDDDVEEGEVD